MRVEPLTPDIAPVPDAHDTDGGAFARALDALGDVLAGAQGAEDAFARGGATLQDAVYERARADVALSVATAAAQRAAQSITAILNMQI